MGANEGRDSSGHMSEDKSWQQVNRQPTYSVPHGILSSKAKREEGLTLCFRFLPFNLTFFVGGSLSNQTKRVSV